MMVHEIGHMLGNKRGDPIGLLVLASLFRDDMPWMYELGIEAYRMAKDGTPEEATLARKQFQKAGDLMRKGPFGFEEMGIDPRMMHMMMREMDHFSERDPDPEPEVEVAEVTAPKPKRKKSDKPE